MRRQLAEAVHGSLSQRMHKVPSAQRRLRVGSHCRSSTARWSMRCCATQILGTHCWQLGPLRQSCSSARIAQMTFVVAASSCRASGCFCRAQSRAGQQTIEVTQIHFRRAWRSGQGVGKQQAGTMLTV